MQNKANPGASGNITTPCTPKTYANIPLAREQKNKPNQTQFIPRDTPPSPLAAQYAIRETNPILARRTAKAAPAHGPAGPRRFLNFCSKNSLTGAVDSLKY